MKERHRDVRDRWQTEIERDTEGEIDRNRLKETERLRGRER